MFHVKHVPDLTELRESIRLHGMILPVYYHNGRVLDGSRRGPAALQVGLIPRQQTIDDPVLAARLLWSLHPDRALREFASNLQPMAAARLFDCRPSQIIALLRPALPKVRKPYSPSIGSQLKTRVSSAAKAQLLSLSLTHHATLREVVEAMIWLALNHPEHCEEEIKKERWKKLQRPKCSR